MTIMAWSTSILTYKELMVTPLCWANTPIKKKDAEVNAKNFILRGKTRGMEREG